ncbi:exported hypothetical protein [uncultured Dysgonomonas sp.]|uniref:Uncharacterized protein n=1 Tax=uncultured Dysgonomonas sp. TaxID=206096 RepID=A0A212KFN6_9BACT|nr:hypothetical protein [uncultured Dysgonomonas sp.]SBW10452.1 exported hypothetical protein [uncultured Dysgonomonas sp.]
MKKKMKKIILILLWIYVGVPLFASEKILEVKKHLTVDNITTFNTIGAALKVAIDGDKVRIFEGIYEEYGLLVPDGVSLIGIGYVHIKGELPETVTTRELENISTIDMFNNGSLENLFVTAKNMRYPVHSDFSRGGTKQEIVNCRFIHYGNRSIYNYRLMNKKTSPDGPTDVMKVQSAWGGGTKGGDKRYFKGCYFESPLRAFSTHNNVNFNETLGASLTVLEDCEMISHGIDVDGVDIGFTAPVVIQSLPSKSPDKIILTNCKINGYLCFHNPSTHEIYCNTPGLKMVFNVLGGSKVIRDQIGTVNNNLSWYPRIVNEINAFKNISLQMIARGKAVKRSSYGIELMTDKDDSSLFLGVAMQDIAPKQCGNVKHKGYLLRPYLDGLETVILKEGDNIGVNAEGSFEKKTGLIVCKTVDNQNIEIAR